MPVADAVEAPLEAGAQPVSPRAPPKGALSRHRYSHIGRSCVLALLGCFHQIHTRRDRRFRAPVQKPGGRCRPHSPRSRRPSRRGWGRELLRRASSSGRGLRAGRLSTPSRHHPGPVYSPAIWNGPLPESPGWESTGLCGSSGAQNCSMKSGWPSSTRGPVPCPRELKEPRPRRWSSPHSSR